MTEYVRAEKKLKFVDPANSINFVTLDNNCIMSDCVRYITEVKAVIIVYSASFQAPFENR